MRPEHLFPIYHALPGWMIENVIVGDHEHVGIPQASASHAAAVQSEHISEEAELEDAKTAQGGGPKKFVVVSLMASTYQTETAD